jgi:hypothetical protein
MRRTILASLATWLIGGSVLAGEFQPTDIVPTAPRSPYGAATTQSLVPVNGPSLPASGPVTPVGFNTSEVPPAPPAPPAVAAEPTVPVGPIEGGCNGGCGVDSRWFGSVDYVVGWIRHNPTPPLAQVLPDNLNSFVNSGRDLPAGSGRTIFGENGTDPGTFSGVRVMGGFYFDGPKCWGLDGSYFQLFQKADSFAVASPGSPIIGRDFFNTIAAKDAFLRYTTPDGLANGFIRVDAPAEMYTFDGNVRAQGPSMLSDRVDYLAGLRYLRLKDSLTVDSGATIRQDPTATPFIIQSHESFRALNEFYGAQVGFDSHYHWGCFSVEFVGKLAAGWVRERVRIEGYSTTQEGTATPVVYPNQSVLLVQPSNAGSYSRNKFAVLPEGIVNVGYQITPHVRAQIGYDAIVLSNVERSGVAIDPNVNTSLTKYIAHDKNSDQRSPTFRWDGDGWWAQGLTLGLAVNY